MLCQELLASASILLSEGVWVVSMCPDFEVYELPCRSAMTSDPKPCDAWKTASTYGLGLRMRGAWAGSSAGGRSREEGRQA